MKQCDKSSECATYSKFNTKKIERRPYIDIQTGYLKAANKKHNY